MSESSAAVPTEGGRHGRSAVLVAVVVALVVLLVAGGAFAAWRMLSGGGSRPADVLPASTLGVVSVDLDPSGQQKIEAVRTLRKFPSFREEIGVEEDDDLVRALFEELQAEEDFCPEVDYAEDIEPWVGQRFALAAVAMDEEPVPALVVQVTDADAAQSGAEKLQACGEETGGVAVGEEYLVASDTQDHADQILASGEEEPLSGDDDYQRWSGEAGGDGIVDLYAAPEAVDYFASELSDEAEALGPEADELTAQLEAFEGAAASLRFDGGGIVFAAAVGSEDSYEGAPVGDYVGELPGDTAAAFAVAVPEETQEKLEELAEDPGAGPQGDAVGYVAGALASIGLDFPDDLVTLLGEAVSISVGGEAPADLNSPEDLPLGLLVHGDPDEIEQVVTNVEQASGFSLASLPAYLESGEDSVALSSQQDYADALLEDGSLADDEEFQDVVAEADDAQVVLFAELNDSWRDLIVRSESEAGGDSSVAENLEPLRAFGLSAWVEDDVTYSEARLALN